MTRPTLRRARVVGGVAVQLLVGAAGPGCASGARAVAGGGQVPAAPVREVPSRAIAAPSDALATRVDLVAEAFRARGAHPVAERWVSFVREEGAATMAVRAARAQCLGFVAVGRESMGDVNLAVANAAGIQIARDVRNDAHPFARVCVQPATRLYVTVSAVRGSGEVAVLTLVDPPVVPPPLDGVLGVRPGGVFAGPRVPRVAVGTDPAQRTAAESLRRMMGRFAALGYEAVGAVQSGTLDAQHTTQRTVNLEAGRCYAILAAGGGGVEDLDLRVSGPDRRPITQDVATDAHPTVRLCAATTGAHAVDLRMFSGAGAWALGTMEIRAEGPFGGDVVGLERVRALELYADAARRALRPLGPAVRGAPWGGAALEFPLRMRAGRCYLVGVAAGEQAPALEAWLSDGTGAVLASDMGEREQVRVFHCAVHDARVTASVRVPGGRGSFLFQVFESGGEER